MKFGLPISFTLHALCVSGGLMLWQSKAKFVETAKIIPLEIVTVSDRTNIKPTRKEIVEKIEPEKIEVQKPEPEPPKPEIQKPEVTKPIEVIPEQPVEPVPEKTASALKPEEKTTAEPVEETPKPPTFNLDAFSDMVNQSRTDNPDANRQIVLTGEAEQAKQTQSGVGAGDEMTASPTDYIRSRMEPCWHIDKGAEGYQSLRVEVTLDLSDKGEIVSLNIRNSARIIASGSSAWRAARENVVAALNECAPYEGLRSQKYETWKSMKLNFQPGDT